MVCTDSRFRGHGRGLLDSGSQWGVSINIDGVHTDVHGAADRRIVPPHVLVVRAAVQEST